jgi:hypothetical protein
MLTKRRQQIQNLTELPDAVLLFLNFPLKKRGTGLGQGAWAAYCIVPLCIPIYFGVKIRQFGVFVPPL